MRYRVFCSYFKELCKVSKVEGFIAKKECVRRCMCVTLEKMNRDLFTFYHTKEETMAETLTTLKTRRS